MNESVAAVARFSVHSVPASPVGRPVREPHMVIDQMTGQTVDQFASKKAAGMMAAQLNDEVSK